MYIFDYLSYALRIMPKYLFTPMNAANVVGNTGLTLQEIAKERFKRKKTGLTSERSYKNTRYCYFY